MVDATVFDRLSGPAEQAKGEGESSTKPSSGCHILGPDGYVGDLQTLQEQLVALIVGTSKRAVVRDWLAGHVADCPFQTRQARGAVSGSHREVVLGCGNGYPGENHTGGEKHQCQLEGGLVDADCGQEVGRSAHSGKNGDNGSSIERRQAK